MPAGARERAGDEETAGIEVMVEATGGGGTGTKVTTPGDEATGPTTVAKISNLTIENRGDGLKGGREGGRGRMYSCQRYCASNSHTNSQNCSRSTMSRQAFDVSILKKVG